MDRVTELSSHQWTILSIL